MVKLYTIHCPKCKVLETKLKQKNIPFESIDDEEIIKTAGVKGIPSLEVDGEMLAFSDANSWINKQ